MGNLRRWCSKRSERSSRQRLVFGTVVAIIDLGSHVVAVHSPEQAMKAVLPLVAVPITRLSSLSFSPLPPRHEPSIDDHSTATSCNCAMFFIVQMPSNLPNQARCTLRDVVQRAECQLKPTCNDVRLPSPISTSSTPNSPSMAISIYASLVPHILPHQTSPTQQDAYIATPT